MKRISILVLAAATFGVNLAHAASIQGFMWKVPEAQSQTATPGNIPGRQADVSFWVDSSLLNFGGINNTVSSFLSSGSAFNIAENTPGTLASQLENGVFGAIFSFSGMIDVVTNQTFTSTHDDGIALTIGGVNLGFYSSPTGAFTETKTYTGASGRQSFQLIYTDCCGGSGDGAVLRLALPGAQSVPEPASLALLGLGALFMPRFSRRLIANTPPENK